MDVALADLWLPIVVSAAVVFIASFIAWTISPHHKGEWIAVPDEAAFMGSVRDRIPAGQYMFPHCDPKNMKDPEVKKKYMAGPHGVLTVWPAAPNMIRNMVLTFAYFLVVGLFVGYVTSHAVSRGGEYLAVFRVAGTAAIMVYALGGIPHAIWFGRSARSVVSDMVDGVVYGLLTAGCFGAMWPDAPAMPV